VNVSDEGLSMRVQYQWDIGYDRA